MKKNSTTYERLKDAFFGLTDEQLGIELEVTKSAVSQWKAETTEPHLAALLLAEEKTGIPYKWFSTGDPKYLEQYLKDAGEGSYEALFNEVSKLDPQSIVKFHALMRQIVGRVAEMKEGRKNEPPRKKSSKS